VEAQFSQAIEMPLTMPTFDFPAGQMDDASGWDNVPAELHFPPWMADAEFDVTALNSWVASTLDPNQTAVDPGLQWRLPPPVQNQPSDPRTRESPHQSTRNTPSVPPISPAGTIVQQPTVSDNHFDHARRRESFVSDDKGSQAGLNMNKSGADANDAQVDEVYRTRLAKQVRSKWTGGLLPSTDFLVSIPKSCEYLILDLPFPELVYTTLLHQVRGYLPPNSSPFFSHLRRKLYSSALDVFSR
jgi:hypothetical protein